MERKKYLWIALLWLSFVVVAQNNSAIYQAYIRSDMLRWKQVMDSLEQQPGISSRQVLEVVNYQYGYIAWCLSKKKKDEAALYIAKASGWVHQLETKRFLLAELNAYKAALVGYRIALSPYKAPLLGPESAGYAETSVAMDKGNVMGYVQLGNIAFYKPAFFGGSKTEAIQHYLRALTLMEHNREYLASNWNYLNLLAAIITAYTATQQYELAKKYCVKTLAVEPGFLWVKNGLYPQLLKKK